MHPSDAQVRRGRNAVAAVFAANGLAFAAWVSRIPDARAALGLDPGELGLLLLALSLGALTALPTAGWWVHRHGPARVVAGAAVLAALGLTGAGLAVSAAAGPGAAGPGAGVAVGGTAAGLLLLGVGSGTWDVAMNIEGAEVERALRRSVMPRFHAAFSLGTVAGAATGALAAWGRLPVGVHLAVAAVLVLATALSAVRSFLPVSARRGAGAASAVTLAEPHGGLVLAWREPRTLALGLMVLAMALTEGVANDWLAVALVDGYGVETWVGVAGFALFVTAMTAGRTGGTALLDRFGRVPVLWGSMALAGAGVLLVVQGPAPVAVVLGIVLWGLGASLGFPVGMSAAADEPARAPARVSVVSTIGYTAFLAGPPVVGFLGDRVGVLAALLVVAALLVPSALVVPAAREVRQAG